MDHHGYLGEEGGCLKYSHNPQHRDLVWFQTAQIFFLEMNTPPAPGHGIGDRVEDRCFSCTVGTDQAEQLMGIDVEIKLVDGSEGSEGDG